MSCRSTPAGSVSTTVARFASGRVLSDPAVLSLFHETRRTAPQFTLDRIEQDRDGRYQAALDIQERYIQQLHRDGDITDARRASLMSRLDAARAQAAPDARTIHALSSILSRSAERSHTLTGFVRSIANRTGTTEEEVWTAYRAAEENAPRQRGRHAIARDEEASARRGAAGHVANDPGVLYAMNQLEEIARVHEIARAAEQPQRAPLSPVAGNVNRETGVRVTRAGYDPRASHLVVETVDSEGNTQTHAYRNVPENTYQRIASGDATAEWMGGVRGNADMQYSNNHEAALASVAPRCPNCGQFADASHSCPVPEPTITLGQWRSQQRWSIARVDTRDSEGNVVMGREDSIRLPAIRELRNSVSQGAVRITDINGYMHPVLEDGEVRRGAGHIRGNITVSRAEDGSLNVSTASLRCSCDAYRANGDCPHLHQVEAAVRNRIDPPSRPRSRMTPEERERAVAEAQVRAEAAAATDWTRQDETRADAAATWRRESEVLYSESPDAFRQDVAAAREAAAAKDGAAVIPYMRENALDGMATRDSGQGFGVEVEFDFPSTMDYSQRRQAQQAIAQELYAAGITRSDRQERYGYSRQFGFVDQHTDPTTGNGTWCFENDGSVGGGELVTPVMYDEPETWEKLDKAVEIIKRHGGVPSKKAGAHVHVGTGGFNGSPAAYTELGRMVTQHEDVMYRLASDPSRGTHRNNGYSKPLGTVPADGFQDVREVRSWQRQRYSAVNFAHVAGGASDHPEFRLFDSSLDSGTLQSQVKIAVATVNAAKRNADSGGTTRGKEAWGSHAERAKARGTRRRFTDEEFDADSATTRSLIDTLFRRREDKAQMAALFANTKWTKPKGSR